METTTYHEAAAANGRERFYSLTDGCYISLRIALGKALVQRWSEREGGHAETSSNHSPSDELTWAK